MFQLIVNFHFLDQYNLTAQYDLHCGLDVFAMNICYIVLKYVLFAIDDMKKGMKV